MDGVEDEVGEGSEVELGGCKLAKRLTLQLRRI
jgi:hypothetical protein